MNDEKYAIAALRAFVLHDNISKLPEDDPFWITVWDKLDDIHKQKWIAATLATRAKHKEKG